VEKIGGVLIWLFLLGVVLLGGALPRKEALIFGKVSESPRIFFSHLPMSFGLKKIPVLDLHGKIEDQPEESTGRGVFDHVFGDRINWFAFAYPITSSFDDRRQGKRGNRAPSGKKVTVGIGKPRASASANNEGIRRSVTINAVCDLFGRMRESGVARGAIYEVNRGRGEAETGAFFADDDLHAVFSYFRRVRSCVGSLCGGFPLPPEQPDRRKGYDCKPPLRVVVPAWIAARCILGMMLGLIGGVCVGLAKTERQCLGGLGLMCLGFATWLTGYEAHNQAEQSQEYDRCRSAYVHRNNTVSQQFLLTSTNYCDTLIVREGKNMANVLDKNKQVQIIAALAEGSGIRQIERMTGVHRDTIMRLGVRVGKGCQSLLDAKMRNLTCAHLQCRSLMSAFSN
jgi:hypothetical protein